MSSFAFTGTFAASKSLFNRALIVKSYFNNFDIYGQSSCEDIVLMQKAILRFSVQPLSFQPIVCKNSGTALRFLALRASREKGNHTLVGTERLMKRLPQPLLSLLWQLGCETEIGSTSLKIKSRGWTAYGDGIYVSATKSSQFASALLLNCWNLDREIHFALEDQKVSQSYFFMTKKFLKRLGFCWTENKNEFTIPAHQKIKTDRVHIEIDLSSAFCIGVVATLFGRANFLNFPTESLQPDIVLVDILSRVGATVVQKNRILQILKAESLKPLSVDCTNYPDLVPCLSVLLAFANGKSTITGISHLKDKESNRLQKIYELLSACNIKIKKTNSSLEIYGPINNVSTIKAFNYHTNNDHRMAMAAGILKKYGIAIHIEDPESVCKSFPKFWEILNGSIDKESA